MIHQRKKRALRALLLSAIAVAALSCIGVFFTAGAAGEEVSPSDTDSFVAQGEADSVRMLFRPDAVYNGSYYSELTANEQKVYDVLVRYVLTEQTTEPFTIDVSAMRYLKSDNKKISEMILIAMNAFQKDHPETCWISTGSQNMVYDGDFVESVIVRTGNYFSGSLQERDTILNGIEAAVNRIMQNRTSDSRYDTVKAIHDDLCEHASYAYDNETGCFCAAPVFGGANKDGKIICAGYADAFKILCDRLGVPAAVVGSEIHAYNYVQMEDGCWYVVDCTWDDGGDPTPPSYRYFLVGNRTAVNNSTQFCQETDHQEYPYYCLNNKQIPLAYPPLSDVAYTPDGGAIFWEDCNEESRTVSGVVPFTWKYKGNPSDAASVTVTLDFQGSTLATVGTFRFDSEGFVTVGIDTSQVGHNYCYVSAQVGNVRTFRKINVDNRQFELLNWEEQKAPVLSDTFYLNVRGYSTVDVTQCEFRSWIDSVSLFSGNFPADGLLSIPINTNTLGKGYHKFTVEFTNTFGEWFQKQLAFYVYNPETAFNGFSFWGESASEGRLVGDIAEFMLKYDGTATDGCRLNVTVDGAPVPVYLPYAAGMGDFFDANGIGVFHADISGQSNGAHTVKAELVGTDGSRVASSVGIQVTDGYFTIENLGGDNPILTNYMEVTFRNISSEPNEKCRLNFSQDGRLSFSDYSFSSSGTKTLSWFASNNSEGQHWEKIRFTAPSGTVVEKIRRFRVKHDSSGEESDDSFGFAGESAEERRYVGEYANFRLYYGGVSPEDCTLSVTLDGSPVAFHTIAKESPFDSSGNCVFFVDVRGQSNGEHVVKAILTCPDGSTKEDERTVIVTDGYFTIENWPSESTVVTGDYSYTKRNISGEPGSNCFIGTREDGSEENNGGTLFGDDNVCKTFASPGVNLSDGEHWYTFYFKVSSGVRVWKSLRLTYRYALRPKVPQFSFHTLGASIRLTEPWGIRFGIRIDKNEDFKNAEIVEYGTLLIASGTLGSQELDYYTDKVRRVKAVNLLENDSTHITYTGVLINIPTSFFDTNVKGRGYLIYKDSLGECHIVYSETAEKSFNGVARAAYDSYSKIQNPTDAQKEALRKLKMLLNIS